MPLLLQLVATKYTNAKIHKYTYCLLTAHMMGHLLNWWLNLAAMWVQAACVVIVTTRLLGPGVVNSVLCTLRSLLVAATLATGAELSGQLGRYAPKGHAGTGAVVLLLAAWTDMYFWILRCVLTPSDPVPPCPLAGLAFRASHGLEAALYFAPPVIVSVFLSPRVFAWAVGGLVLVAVAGYRVHRPSAVPGVRRGVVAWGNLVCHLNKMCTPWGKWHPHGAVADKSTLHRRF